LLKKKRKIDDEIQKHKTKYPCLDSHRKVIDHMMQDLTSERLTADNRHSKRHKDHNNNVSMASSSDDMHPTSITAEAAETSSVTTAASTY